MKRSYSRQIAVFVVAMFAAVTVACSQTDDRIDETGGASGQNSQAPSIEITPLKPGDGAFHLATSETVSFTVTAPEAREVRLLHRPVSGADGHFVLAKIADPADAGGGRFTAQMKLPPDFSGEVWAEAVYADGVKKQTEPVALAVQGAGDLSGAPAAQRPAQGTPSGVGGAVGQTVVTPDDESARSDKFWESGIEETTLKASGADIAITVNAPAFQLTLWQGGKEVKAYDIGIGRKSFPVVIGERQVTEIIFNPNWVPPDSEWVRESEGIEPYERIPPGDPRNPLGSLKIPLGDAYLIHEAAKPSDIGSLVSHGCIRMLREDIFDLAEKIIKARALSVTGREIEALKGSSERRVVRLDPPLTVDINYDTLVVEAGVLHIYPDVYDREGSRAGALRAELREHVVDVSRLDEKSVETMLARVSLTDEYTVRIADIESGRALATGKSRPLTGQPASGRGAEKDPPRQEGDRRRR